MSTFTKATIQAKVQVLADDMSYDLSQQTIAFGFGSVSGPVLDETELQVLLKRQAGSGNRDIIAGAWSGSYSLSTWYTLKAELERDGTNYYKRLWVDGTLRSDVTEVNAFDVSNFTAVLYADILSSAWTPPPSGPYTHTIQAQWDDYYYWLDGVQQEYDDFSDGDLTSWPATMEDLSNSETGGVYEVNDAVLIYYFANYWFATSRNRSYDFDLPAARLHIFTGYKAGHLMRAWEA